MLCRKSVSLTKANQILKTKTSIMCKDEQRYVSKIFTKLVTSMLHYRNSILFAKFATVDNFYRLELQLSPYKNTELLDQYLEYRKIKEEQRVSGISLCYEQYGDS